MDEVLCQLALWQMNSKCHLGDAALGTSLPAQTLFFAPVQGSPVTLLVFNNHTSQPAVAGKDICMHACFCPLSSFLCSSSARFMWTTWIITALHNVTWKGIQGDTQISTWKMSRSHDFYLQLSIHSKPLKQSKFDFDNRSEHSSVINKREKDHVLKRAHCFPVSISCMLCQH